MFPLPVSDICKLAVRLNNMHGLVLPSSRYWVREKRYALSSNWGNVHSCFKDKGTALVLLLFTLSYTKQFLSYDFEILTEITLKLFLM